MAQKVGEAVQSETNPVADRSERPGVTDRKSRAIFEMDNELAALRVIIADDHALVRGGVAMLVRMLYKDCEIIETNDYTKTLEALSNEQEIDLLLLDLQMPGLNGIEDIVHICRKWPDVPVVLVTVEENNSIIHSALKAGVSGYIPKSSTPEVTMSAIRLVLSGGIYVPLSAIRSTGGDDGGPAPADLTEAKPAATKPGLTKRQCEVLDLIVLGKSNQAISEALGLTPGTVKAHLCRIFKVLNVKNRTEAARKYASL